MVCEHGASTHGLGIPEAVALGRVLDQLVVYAVEAADVDLRVGLSPAVAAVPTLVNAVLAELPTG